METTIDEAVLALNENHGYNIIAVIMGDSSIDTRLVAERRVLASTSNSIIITFSTLFYF